MKTLKIFLSIIILNLNLFSSDQIPGRKQTKPIALINGSIHTVTNGTLNKGTILFENGKITAIGESVVIPSNAEVIDISGKHVYPSLISITSQIGLVEIEAARPTRDNIETGKFNPNVRAEITVNPDGELIPTTRTNGILLTHTMPEGGIVSGKSAVLKMDGWTQEDMVLDAPTGLVVNWPNMTPSQSPFLRATEEEQKKERDKDISDLKNLFENGKAYQLLKKNGNYKTDLKLESLEPFINGNKPLYVSANSQLQIESAVQFAKELNLKIVIVGGGEAIRVSDLLKKENVPVILTDIYQLPSKNWHDPDYNWELPKKMYEAGLQFAVGMRGENSQERNIPFHTGFAVAHGLPYDEALKSITINAAKILGIENKVGSLEVGKDATLFISNGDPLEITSNVERAFIDGRIVDLTSHHTELRDKYIRKYEDLGVLKKKLK
ncbi:MAG: amidohydrolase family protein [Bacteroidetes bacterium]|nr:amidohydrolase family protein [Bacteroidota bacterium]